MRRKRKNGKNTDGRKALITESADFDAVEAYKIIRANLKFALLGREGRSIMITSPCPGEGKSTNCSNLGITLAETGSRVLLLDCDLRKPVMHKHFDRICSPGLSELLAGISSISEVTRVTDYQNLNLICGGVIPPNPAELLGSAAMGEILQSLCEDYEYVFLDAPPVNPLADALALSPLVDGVVVVVKQGSTTYPELNRALFSLKFANAKVAGVILNQSKPKGRYRYIGGKKKGYYGHKKKMFKDHEM